MNPARPDPARRIRAASDWLRAWAAVLADPDSHGYHERSVAWLSLALLVSLAAHVFVLSMLAAAPRMYAERLHLTLSARLAPAAEPVPLPQAEPMPPAPQPAAAPEPAPAARETPPPEPAKPAPAAAPEPAAEPGTPLILPERYFRSRDLDVPAVPLGRAPLYYPEGAFHHRLRGTVRLRVYIGADGAVESMEVVHATPPNYHFEEAALNAMRLMRYKPALKDGQPVPSQKLIDVEFDPDETPQKPAAARPPA